MKFLKSLILSLNIFCFCSFAIAEDVFKREMETDRPDFTEGALTVESGHLQVEAGYTFVTDSEDGVDVDSHDGPEVLLRVGVAEKTELRFFWEGYINEQTDIAGVENTSEGVSDVSIGFKHTMGSQDGLIPEHAIIAELGIPVGSEEFTNDKVQPVFKFIWAYEINEQISIAGNLNFDFPIVEDERQLELSSSLAAAYGITEEVGAYVEYFGFYPDESGIDISTTHFLNGGFTYLLNSNLQFDIRVGTGLNDDADDFFTGIGLAFRL